jgi:hypothetical protein
MHLRHNIVAVISIFTGVRQNAQQKSGFIQSFITATGKSDGKENPCHR